MRGLKWRLQNTFWGLRDLFMLLPLRLLRFFQHFGQPVNPIYREVFPRSYPLFWGLEVLIRFLEILGIGDLYQIISGWLKFNTRPLMNTEKEILATIFGPGFPFHRIHIDEWALLGPPQMQICYVSFWTINSWRQMSTCLLVHEMVHVWQYQQLGMVYIPRALAAQGSHLGYNYGGVGVLQRVYAQEGKLSGFNLEQQADIIADYCRIKKGLGPSWGVGSWVDLPFYQYFVDQLILPTSSAKKWTFSK